jgi:hypothetical protein
VARGVGTSAQGATGSDTTGNLSIEANASPTSQMPIRPWLASHSAAEATAA